MGYRRKRLKRDREKLKETKRKAEGVSCEYAFPDNMDNHWCHYRDGCPKRIAQKKIERYRVKVKARFNRRLRAILTQTMDLYLPAVLVGVVLSFLIR